MVQADETHDTVKGEELFDSFPLIDSMLERRSRRFGMGNTMNGGGLAFQSKNKPVPLTMEEEARLVFAGAGFTSAPMGDLPYDTGSIENGGSGNIMVSLTGRTSPSADGCHTAILFVLNDDGGFMIRRPQEMSPEDRLEIIRLGQEHRYVEAYEKMRVRISDSRPDVLRDVPIVPPFNRWSANVPGSTYFVPVSETTTLALTLLFLILGEEMAMFPMDERNGFKPAGIGKFAKSKGGWLHDNPNDLRLGTVNQLETYVHELISVEQGLMIQNIVLAAEAMGLGHFPHYGAHLWAWPEAFGFRMRRRRMSKAFFVGRAKARLMSLTRRNPLIPMPVGLTVNGERLIKPFCPPHYANMTEAVQAFVDMKYAEGKGVFRDPSQPTGWKDPAAILGSIPRYSDQNIAAVTAFCEYLYQRYGQFGAYWGPLRTVMGLSTHHIDPEFYDTFYKEGAYSGRHANHFQQWHRGTEDANG